MNPPAARPAVRAGEYVEPVELDTADLAAAWDVLATASGGEVGICLAGLDGIVATRDADRAHYAASTMKLAVLAALLRDRAAGRPGAAGEVQVHDRFPSRAGGFFVLQRADDQDDPTWRRLGESVEVMDVAERMITVSSNIATDLLIESVGLGSVADLLAEAGLASAVQVHHLIGDSAARAAGITNTVTATGLAQLMRHLANGSLLNAADSRTALAMLARQEHRGMIPAGLPTDAWSASKGGWVPGVNHDVALVRPQQAPPYVLAVCTTSALDTRAGQHLVARISEVTWRQWSTWHGSSTKAAATGEPERPRQDSNLRPSD